MKDLDRDAMILRFFRDDLGGILITDAKGTALYKDERTAFFEAEQTNWRAACPPPYPEQRAEMWDLFCHSNGKTYMVVTSTFVQEGEMAQIHCLVDTSVYMSLYRDISAYSRTLQNEKERDGLTGLYNKGKFLALKHSLFQGQDAIAVFNMDVNNLKHMNDTYGHEAGDRLIQKAAESLKRIEMRNVIPFRVGGDEFIVAAIHVDRAQAEKIKRDWEKGLEELNRRDDGVPCQIACGFAFGDAGYDLEEVLAAADRRMYEDKKAKKQNGQPR